MRASLPALVLLKGDRQRARPYIEDILRLILREAASGEPCAQVIINRLVRVLLIKAVSARFTALMGKAFTRWAGTAPGSYRQTLRATAAAPPTALPV